MKSSESSRKPTISTEEQAGGAGARPPAPPYASASEEPKGHIPPKPWAGTVPVVVTGRTPDRDSVAKIIEVEVSRVEFGDGIHHTKAEAVARQMGLIQPIVTFGPSEYETFLEAAVVLRRKLNLG